MNIEYQFELVVTRLFLSKSLTTQGIFRATLLDTHREVDLTSNCFQTEVTSLAPHQKIVVLSGINSFIFRTGRQVLPGSMILKYEVKGLGDEYVESVHLNIKQMINEFKSKNKVMFVQKFAGKGQKLEYKVYISKYQATEDPDYLIALDTKNSKKQLASKEQEVTFPQTEVVPAKHGKDEEVDEKNDIVMKICSAKVRARPPQLVISKNSEKAKPWSRPLSLSPLPMAELATPAYTKKDTFDEGQSIPLLKKISSLPLSEIEKVNQLLVTHYRLEDKAKEVSLSYKLKIVILMTIIGVFFMLYDTIGDRSLRRKALITKVQKKPGKGEKEKQEGQEGQEKKEKKGKGDNDKGKNKDKPRKKDKGSRKAPSNDV